MSDYPFPFWIAYSGFVIAVSAMVVLALRSLFCPRDQRRCEIGVVAFALSIPFYMAIGFFLSFLSGLIPGRYDLYLARIDGLLGFQPSAVVNHILSRSPFLFGFTAFFYKALPAIGVLLFVTYLWKRSEREAVGVLKALLLNAALSVPCYFLVPSCGPIYAFSGFPRFPEPLPVAHTVVLVGAPNAMPSIHFSTALLIYWYSRHSRIGQVLGALFILLTVAATLGFGEHYLIDLVMAIPYAVAIQWLSSRLWAGGSDKPVHAALHERLP